ncbi:hypothetical protein QN277_010288 [Acacia crassicarpa]|uniref:Uncharacterized protein n=1 Tax=Acacia crassicarpa TaxID=499986 RepID=A0AAE1JLF9_9FABA|nr:hypothetical protein QN277_010288 [Acacia crassicarpa]
MHSIVRSLLDDDMLMKVVVFVVVQVLVYFIVSNSSGIFSDTKHQRSDSFKLARSASIRRILALLADLPSEEGESYTPSYELSHQSLLNN